VASTKNKYTLDALHFIAFSTAKAATPISQVNPFPVKKVQGDAEIRSFFVPSTEVVSSHQPKQQRSWPWPQPS